MVSAQCIEGFCSDSVVKNLPAMQEMWVGSLGGQDPLEEMALGLALPTPVCLPGKTHGQRSLVGYSPWGHKKLDTTKRLNNSNT